MKTLYILRRDCFEIAQVWYEKRDSQGSRGLFRLPIEPSLKAANHSPTGFEWGYRGSGPAQLALALLLHHTGSPLIALALYQSFKEDVIARIPKSGLLFSNELIKRFIERTNYEKDPENIQS